MKILIGILIWLGSWFVTQWVDKDTSLWEKFFLINLLLYVIGFFSIWLGILENFKFKNRVKYTIAVILGVTSFYIFAKVILNL